MTDAGREAPGSFADALLAARLCALEPRLGGMVLRGGGELRDRIVTAIDLPVRRLPVNIDEDRLVGGLDLAATLARGAKVLTRGLLAEAAGGVLLVPLAERLPDATAGKIAAAMDAGDGPLLIMLDDGIEPDDHPPEILMERVAFRFDLDAMAVGGAHQELEREPRSISDDEAARSLATIALALGVQSARADVQAMRCARASAASRGSDSIDAADIELAARLVLAPRATRLPASEESSAPAPAPPEPGEGDDQRGDAEALADVVLEAVLATLPPHVLAELAAGRTRGSRLARNGRGKRRAGLRGRPLGARAGKSAGGARLSLIDTLRAAAPWQKLRGRVGRVQIRRDDLRIRRFETREEAVTIFSVDASGSSAFARLAEAKGAIELLLGEAYVKRAQVALIAFRGEGAELLLPPTRSLVRARRLLAELPGGGGTPLAAGLHAAQQLAATVRAGGRTPMIVVMTDGRANVALDGGTVRARAEADARSAAKAIAQAGTITTLIDISTRPRRDGAALAEAMGARYLPLPRADAASLHTELARLQRP